MTLIDKIKALKKATQEFEDLMVKINDAGMPPHSDFWCQSIHAAKSKVKKSYESLNIKG